MKTIENQVNTGFNISNMYWDYCLPDISLPEAQTRTNIS